MMNMNKQMKLPEIQKIMQEFEKQSEIMDMKEEMMNDVIGKTNDFLVRAQSMDESSLALSFVMLNQIFLPGTVYVSQTLY